MTFEEICSDKQSGKIKATWKDIALKFNLKSAESARQKWKRIRREKGLLPGMHEQGKIKILIVSDFHYPFNLPKEVFKNYIGKVDICVFNGDIQDSHAISKYIKKYRVPFINELIGCRSFLIDLINYIKPKKAIFNYGNHEARLLQSLDKRLSEELMPLMPNSSLSLICDTGFWSYDHKEKTKTFYESLKDVFDDVEIIYTDSWDCRIGNTIIAHPKAFRSGILKTTEKAYLWFLQNGEELFDCIVLSHTHHCGLGRYGKTFLYETGCLCQDMGYNEAKLVRPMDTGFVYLIQDSNGDFLYDESKLVCL